MKKVHLFFLLVSFLLIACQAPTVPPPGLTSNPQTASDKNNILLPSGPAANVNTNPEERNILLPSGPAANVNTNPEENNILLPSGPAAGILLPSGPAAGFTAPESLIAAPPKGFTYPPRGFTNPPQGFSAMNGKILLPSGPAAKILLPSGPAAGILLPSGPAAGILLPSGPAAGFTTAQTKESQQVTIKINGQFYTLILQNEQTLPDGSKQVQFFLPQIPISASGNEAALYLPGSEHPTLMASLNQLLDSSFNSQQFSLKTTALTLLKRQKPKMTVFDLDANENESQKILNELKEIFSQKLGLDTRKEEKLKQQLSQSASNIPIQNRIPERIDLKLPSPLLIVKGQTLQLNAEIFFSDGSSSQNILWASSNPAVALVETNEKKLVTFESGLTTLTASVAGSPLSKSLKIRVVTEEELKVAKILQPEKPTLKLLKPTNGQSFTLGSNVKVEAELSTVPDDFHDILFMVGNQVLGEAKTAPYSVNWNTENVGKGEHTIQAKVRDSKGETLLNLAETTVSIFTSSGTVVPAAPTPTPTPTVSSSPIPATIIYVNSTATGANDGSSWSNAYRDLQSALTTATNGQNIWVAAGTYKPTTGANRNATFTLKNGVTVYGGFAGTETALNQRDFNANVCILDGDINGDDVGLNANDENVYHVVTGATGGSLDGVTIRGGNADGSVNAGLGGGFFESATSSTLTNITFINNNATSGSAIAMVLGASTTVNSSSFTSHTAGNGTILAKDTANATLSNLTISNNTGSAGTGGIAIKDTANVILSASTLTGNTANSLNGGAMAINDSATVSVLSSTFTNNGSTLVNGGAIHCEGTTSTLSVTSGLFNNNTATGNGGAISLSGACNAGIQQSIFHSNSAANGGGIHADTQSVLALTSTLLNSNTVTGSGGGIKNTSRVAMIIDFSTIQGNSSNGAGATGGGISLDGNAFTVIHTIRNSIIRGNIATVSGSQMQIAGTNLLINISYSNIETGIGNPILPTCPGACPGHIDGQPISINSTTGNINADALFINANDIDGADNTFFTADDGLNLQVSSTSKNVGNPLTAVLKDILGTSRVVGAGPDIGAYEN